MSQEEKLQELIFDDSMLLIIRKSRRLTVNDEITWKCSNKCSYLSYVNKEEIKKFKSCISNWFWIILALQEHVIVVHLQLPFMPILVQFESMFCDSEWLFTAKQHWTIQCEPLANLTQAMVIWMNQDIGWMWLI